MSISTLESRPSRNALDAGHAAQDESAQVLQGVVQDIKSAFLMLGIVPAQQLALPCVDHARQREGTTTVREAMLELIQDGQVDDELVALLDRGTSVQHDALITKLRDTYIERTASDVAAYRV